MQAANETNEESIEHDKSRIGLAFFAKDDAAIAILQVNSDDLRIVTLLLAHLEVIDSTDFCDDCGAMLLELWLDLLEDFNALHINWKI